MNPEVSIPLMKFRNSLTLSDFTVAGKSAAIQVRHLT